MLWKTTLKGQVLNLVFCICSEYSQKLLKWENPVSLSF